MTKCVKCVASFFVCDPMLRCPIIVLALQGGKETGPKGFVPQFLINSTNQHAWISEIKRQNSM